MRPIKNSVLIKPIEEDKVTKGGIIIPDTAKEKPQKGIVISIGEGTTDDPMVVNVNDVVMFGKYAGNEVNIDNEDYLIVNQSDILMIL